MEKEGTRIVCGAAALRPSDEHGYTCGEPAHHAGACIAQGTTGGQKWLASEGRLTGWWGIDMMGIDPVELEEALAERDAAALELAPDIVDGEPVDLPAFHRSMDAARGEHTRPQEVLLQPPTFLDVLQAMVEEWRLEADGRVECLESEDGAGMDRCADDLQRAIRAERNKGAQGGFPAEQATVPPASRQDAPGGPQGPEKKGGGGV